MRARARDKKCDAAVVFLRTENISLSANELIARF